METKQQPVWAYSLKELHQKVDAALDDFCGMGRLYVRDVVKHTHENGVIYYDVQVIIGMPHIADQIIPAINRRLKKSGFDIQRVGVSLWRDV